MLSEDDAPQAFIAPECAVADVQQTVGQFEGFDVQRAVERMRANLTDCLLYTSRCV